MNIPDIKLFKSKGSSGSEKYIKRLYPEFYKYIYDKYPNLCWREKLYLFYNNLDEQPKCECGNPCKFINFTEGYRLYCSKQCMYKSELRNNKIKKSNQSKTPEEKELIKQKHRQTCIDRYGCINPWQEKAKQTNLEKYGVENPFASKEIIEKIKQTNLERYGVEYPMQSDIVKEKHEKTLLEKYGVKHYLQLPEYNTYLSNEDENQDIRKRKCPHPECGLCQEKWYETSDSVYHDRKQTNIELCTRLYPIQKFRNQNTSIERFVQSILDKNNIEYEIGNKNILNGYELDIYIPSKQIAIECNGIYWHSSQNHVPHNKHWIKYKKCQDKGIHLITFWEDQIKLYPDKIEQILLSKLGIFTNRIGASKCKIKPIEYQECNSFISQYHLQGNANGESVRLGLFYKDELVSIMTFGKSRYSKNNGWELYRYCTKSGYQIIGGASKLLRYFETHYNPMILESFSSNDISNGDIYKTLGFTQEKEYSPSYWYIHKTDLKRYHRSHFTKNKLIEMGCDPTKSEYQITTDLGYFRIFDCGQSKFIKKY